MIARSKKWLVLLGAVLYLIIGVLAINRVTVQVTNQYHNLLATKALDIAKIVGVSYYLTDREVQELRELDFRGSLNHPATIRLKSIFTRSNFSEDIKFAYIMVKLNPDEIRYYVTADNADWYGLPAGTPLNLLWLTDVIINPLQQKQVSETANYYDDNNRYSFMYEPDSRLYESRESASVISKDEYGSAFTGLVPIYTVEGNYVGLLGIDIYYEHFIRFTQNIRLFLSIIFLLPTIILSLAYILFHVYEARKNNTFVNMDPLTSLHNRRFLDTAFCRITAKCAQNGEPLAVLMIDLDYFKNYNDSYGHQAGDFALISISKVILSALQHKADIACRYGGEEIIIILPNTDVAGAVVVAEKIKTAIFNLNLPHASSPVSKFVTVSQGIFASTPLPGEESQFVSDSIFKADQALYQAKTNGRNRYEVYSLVDMKQEEP